MGIDVVGINTVPETGCCTEENIHVAVLGLVVNMATVPANCRNIQDEVVTGRFLLFNADSSWK